MRLRLFGYTGHDDGQVAPIDVGVATTDADEAGEIVGEVLTRLCIAETDRRERDAAPPDVCHPGAACSKPEEPSGPPWNEYARAAQAERDAIRAAADAYPIKVTDFQLGEYVCRPRFVAMLDARDAESRPKMRVAPPTASVDVRVTPEDVMRWQRDHATMLANLTATQARCTAQEQEIRGLRRSYGGVVGRDGMVWSSVGGAEPRRQP